MATIERNLKKQSQAVARLIYIYSTAEIVGMSSAEINSRMVKVYEITKGCPQWVAAYVTGYRDCICKGLYSSQKLIFGAVIGGKFYSTHRNRSDYYEKHGISPSDFNLNLEGNKAGHYWAHNLKPYHVGD